MKFITFCEMTREFLMMPLEERQKKIPKWSQIAQKYGVKVIFWGMPIGVKEHIVIVYETGDNQKYFLFQREWLGLGTPIAGKYIKNTRTITVY
ncbi:hypothetical protein ACFL0D_07645 [Thermoproteota archaeon]